CWPRCVSLRPRSATSRFAWRPNIVGERLAIGVDDLEPPWIFSTVNPLVPLGPHDRYPGGIKMIAAATPPRDINTTMDGSREPNCPLAVCCTGGPPNPLSAHAWESPWSLLRAGGFLFRLEPNPSVDDYWAG